MQVYIACGLTHVPRTSFAEYASLLHTLATELRGVGFDPVRYALQDSDPKLADHPFEDRARLCYLWDRDMVESADLVVAEATYPSIGLGIELQIAASRGIPILLCFHRAEWHRARPIEYENPDHSHHTLQIGEGFVSLMALGLPTIARVVAYSSITEAINEIPRVAMELQPVLQRQR